MARLEEWPSSTEFGLQAHLLCDPGFLNGEPGSSFARDCGCGPDRMLYLEFIAANFWIYLRCSARRFACPLTISVS